MPLTPEATTTQPIGPAEAVNSYLRAFYTGDFTLARDLVADDFSFQDPFCRFGARSPSSPGPRDCAV